ncbi:MAG TPA: SGNH/GDSL hydrolase family protein [Candidatus Binatia bacterium]|jgi:lysophospholipase L1-like esterase|nr:SGNH/GDSL hydrolase family protein [Candidatus Binatia bacterium]
MRIVHRLVLVVTLVLVLVPVPALALKRIVLIGDSIQAGTNLVTATNQASAVLQASGNVIVHNFSRPGARMTDAGFFPGMTHAGQSISLLHGPYGYLYGVVINLGTNDYGGAADLTTFINAYTALLDSIPSGIAVACMGPTWSTSEGVTNSLGYTKDYYRYATYLACASRGFPYIEGKNAIPNSTAYFPDGVHPNDAGHQAMGAWLAGQLSVLGWLP